MSEIDDLTKEIIGLENEIETLQEEKRELESEIKDLNDKIDNMRDAAYDIYKMWGEEKQDDLRKKWQESKGTHQIYK